MQTARAIARALVLAGMGLATALFGAMSAQVADTPGRAAADASPADRLADAGHVTLSELVGGAAEIVDLTYPLNSQTQFWPGENYQPFTLKTIATLEKDGVLSKAFCMPEHLGTHLDAPNHFVRDRLAVDQIPPSDLIAPGVMIDVAGPASMDPDLRLTAEHLQAWEQRHGPVPDGAIVLLNTGWHRFWNNMVRYRNMDVQGRMHFPGFAEDAVKLLIKQRRIRGVGIDTLSVDYGLSRDFPVHKALGAANRYALENVANLDKLPPGGFYLVVAPIKIETGSGGPARVLAIVPRVPAAKPALPTQHREP
jgi:kynurenine formamidase